MPERAHVTSVDALEAFRSSLIVYLSKARPTLDEVQAEVVRTRIWLQDDQRTHWENESRRRTRALQEAQAALFSAKLSRFRESSSVEQLMVHRAKRSFDEAEDKLRVIKKWNRDFDNRVEPLVKQMEKLHSVLGHDMVHGHRLPDAGDRRAARVCGSSCARRCAGHESRGRGERLSRCDSRRPGRSRPRCAVPES